MFFGAEAEPLKESLNEEDRRKRSRAAVEQASLEIFLKDLGDEEASGAGGEEGARPHGAEDKGKRSAAPPDAVAAAKTKAGRERARRERLNERCAPCRTLACSTLSHQERLQHAVHFHTPGMPFLQTCAKWAHLSGVLHIQVCLSQRIFVMRRVPVLHTVCCNFRCTPCGTIRWGRTAP